MHPRLTVNYGLRYEPFVPFDQKGGRHTTWVPGVQSTVVPDAPTGILPGDPGLPGAAHEQRSEQLRAAAGSGLGRHRRRESAAATASSISRSTADACGRSAWRGDAAASGRIEDPFGSLGQTEPPPESPGSSAARRSRSIQVSAARKYPVPIRIVYTDQNLRTSYTQHFSASSSARSASSRGGGRLRRQARGRSRGHNYFNAAPFINSPITGQPPTLQNVEQRVPFSPGIISAQSRVLGNFFRSEHAMQR